MVFGEQVASNDGLAWLDVVQADMESANYAFTAVDLCSAGIGAPHIRQRLHFAAYGLDDTNVHQRGAQRGGISVTPSKTRSDGAHIIVAGELDRTGDDVRGLANTDTDRRVTSSIGKLPDEKHHTEPCSRIVGLANTHDTGPQRGLSWWQDTQRGVVNGYAGRSSTIITTGPTNGFWRNVDWIGCRDGKFRPVEPGTSPLVDGDTTAMGELKAYGNAINAELAAEFIKATIAILPGFDLI